MLRGIIEDGRLKLSDGSTLPEGTRVRVEVTQSKTSTPKRSSDPITTIKDIAVRTGIPDLADQHDHYLYGLPKRASAGKRVKKAPSQDRPSGPRSGSSRNVSRRRK
jgi:hypothetical protein